MKAADLKRWRARMGLTKTSAAEVLGCTRDSISRWENDTRIPHYIALACSAVLWGLPANIGPEPPPKRGVNRGVVRP